MEGRNRINFNEGLRNITINLESFVINLCGCLDVIAWIYVEELEEEEKEQFKQNVNRIGLMKTHKKLRKLFTDGLKEVLINLDDWFEKAQIT